MDRIRYGDHVFLDVHYSDHAPNDPCTSRHRTPRSYHNKPGQCRLINTWSPILELRKSLRTTKGLMPTGNLGLEKLQHGGAAVIRP
jgi:hypothetical protein